MVVLVLSLSQLRLLGAVLDSDRTVHVCNISAARFTELHLPLVSATHRLADATGGVHHAVNRAAAGARADRRFLGGDGARRVLHGVVRGRVDPAYCTVDRDRSSNSVAADTRRVHCQRHFFTVSESRYSDHRSADARAFSANYRVGRVLEFDLDRERDATSQWCAGGALRAPG